MDTRKAIAMSATLDSIKNCSWRAAQAWCWHPVLWLSFVRAGHLPDLWRPGLKGHACGFFECMEHITLSFHPQVSICGCCMPTTEHKNKVCGHLYNIQNTSVITRVARSYGVPPSLWIFPEGPKAKNNSAGATNPKAFWAMFMFRLLDWFPGINHTSQHQSWEQGSQRESL